MLKVYETIILPVFFYGCETWSSVLREELSLRISENGAEEDVLT